MMPSIFKFLALPAVIVSTAVGFALVQALAAIAELASESVGSAQAPVANVDAASEQSPSAEPPSQKAIAAMTGMVNWIEELQTDLGGKAAALTDAEQKLRDAELRLKSVEEQLIGPERRVQELESASVQPNMQEKVVVADVESSVRANGSNNDDVLKVVERTRSLVTDEEQYRQNAEASHTHPAWNDRQLLPNQNDAPVFGPDIPKGFVDWDLCNRTVHSNLGGEGPHSGEQSIRYTKVGSAGGGRYFDLVVTASTPYQPYNNAANGLVGGDSCFGVLNVAGSSEVDLLFSFYLSGTNSSVALSNHYFTVYDLDTGKKATEYYTIYQSVNTIYTEDDHSFAITGNLSSGLTFQKFLATERGTGADNPKDPLNLTLEQKRRAVTVDFVQKTQWKVTFGVEGGKGGRNFVFAGLSNLVTTTTTTQPTNPEPDTTTVTTTTPCADLQSCVIYADPHISGFDNTENQGPAYLALLEAHHGKRKASAARLYTFDQRPVDVNAYDTGDFWLVKSNSVNVQGRFRYSGEFTPDMAAIGSVAIGGPFVNGSTFIVEPQDGKVKLDGYYLPDGGNWMNEGGDMRVRQSGGEVEILLPEHVRLLCKRLGKHIDVKITMPRLPGGMDGECGNFDGIAENDEEANILERMGDVRVEQDTLMFDTEFDAPENLL